MKISRARQIAFDVLQRVAMQDAYADEALRSELRGDVRSDDAGLATQLTLGVLRWQRLLDFLIDRDVTGAKKSLDVEVRIALRMGVYQLRFLERVPAHAAVHESVELVKLARKRSAAPLVNAVLRKVANEKSSLGSPADSVASLLPAGLRHAERLGIQCSHPTWLVERWLHVHGEERTQALLAANNRLPPLSGYAFDPQRREKAISSLKQAGCTVEAGILLRDAFTLREGNPSACEAIKKSWIAIQDEASQAVTLLLDVQPGNSVLDLCAAPGGKTLLLARSAGPQGRVIAADLHAHRVRAMAERLEHARIQNVETMTLDASSPLPFKQRFDRILVDAPCSGTGTLARHPEIRWRLRTEDLADLHKKQVSLLRNALPHLAPLGRLVYSTCSLEREENDDVMSEVLAGFGNQYRAIGPKSAFEFHVKESVNTGSLFGSDGFFRTFPPEHGTDGFFAVALQCSGEKA